jgi:ribosomal-protein-serine acetyltransferase
MIHKTAAPALIPLALEHGASLWAVIHTHREDLRRWLPWVDIVHSLQAVERFIGLTMARVPDQGACSWVIWSPQGLPGKELAGQLAGMIGIQRIETRPHRATWGYWLAPPFRGQGWMQQSLGRTLIYVCESRGVQNACVHIAEGNGTGHRFARRMGFTPTGYLPRAELLASGEWVDLVVYELSIQRYLGF